MWVKNMGSLTKKAKLSLVIITEASALTLKVTELLTRKKEGTVDFISRTKTTNRGRELVIV